MMSGFGEGAVQKLVGCMSRAVTSGVGPKTPNMSFKYSPLPSPRPQAFQSSDRQRERERGLPFPVSSEWRREREHVRCGDLEWSGVDEKALTYMLLVSCPSQEKGPSLTYLAVKVFNIKIRECWVKIVQRLIKIN